MKNFELGLLTQRSIIIVVLFIQSVLGFSQTKEVKLELDETKNNQLEVEFQTNKTWQIRTTGKDPWIQILPLKNDRISEATVFTFEYFCPKGLDHMQVYFGPDVREGKSKLVRGISLS